MCDKHIQPSKSSSGVKLSDRMYQLSKAISQQVFQLFLEEQQHPKYQQPASTFPAIQSQLQQIMMKLDNFETDFTHSISKLEARVDRCQETIAQLAVNLGVTDSSSNIRRNLIMNDKFDGCQSNEINRGYGILTEEPRVKSWAENLMSGSSSDSSDLRSSKGKVRSVCSSVKRRIKNAFSAPCIVTPIFEIYPAKMFHQTVSKTGEESMQ